MKRIRYLLISCLCVIFIAGCVEKKVIDDLNIATGLGIDKSDDGQLLGSIMIPVFKPDHSIENFTFTATGSITRDLVAQMQQKASQPIVAGGLDIALFGEEVAREGIIEILDLFLRDPSVGARLYLAIVDGKAVDIFKGQYGDRGNSQYLAELMEHNMQRGSLPLNNLHRFLFNFYQKGQDPYLPLLKKVQPELVSITGLALFKDEKVVDILPENKLFYFKLLVDKHSSGSVVVKDKHGESIVKSIKSKHNFTMIKRNPYEFAINIKINGVLSEHTGETLKKNEVKEIEAQLEKQIVEECTKMIADFQNQKIDPVGFGHYAKTQTRNFDFNKWEESYQSAKFKISADVTITEVGVVE